MISTNQDMFQGVKSGMDEDGESQEEGNDEDERKKEPGIEWSHLGLLWLNYTAKPEPLNSRDNIYSL